MISRAKIFKKTTEVSVANLVINLAYKIYFFIKNTINFYANLLFYLQIHQFYLPNFHLTFTNGKRTVFSDKPSDLKTSLIPAGFPCSKIISIAIG